MLGAAASAEAISWSEESVAFERDAGDQQRLALSLCNLAILQSTLGNIDVAFDGANESWRLASRAGEESIECAALAAMGHSLGLQGRIGEALDAFGRANEVQMRIDGFDLYTTRGEQWGELLLRLGELERGRRLICANREYRILLSELQRAGINQPGPNATRLSSLANPTIDWVSLAKGFGVPAERTESAEQLGEALARALAAPGPALIEAVIT